MLLKNNNNSGNEPQQNTSNTGDTSNLNQVFRTEEFGVETNLLELMAKRRVNNNSGGEVTKIVTSTISELVKANDDKVTMITMDRMDVRYAAHRYSIVLLCRKYDNNVLVYKIGLEGSGNAPMNVNQMVNELVRVQENSFNKQNQLPDIWVADKIVDDEVIINATIKEVGQVYNVSSENIILLEGTVIPYYIQGEAALKSVTEYVYNSAMDYFHYFVLEDKGTTIKVSDIVKRNTGSKIKLEVSMCNSTTNKLGETIACDAVLRLGYHNAAVGESKSYNNASISYAIAEVAIRLDFAFQTEEEVVSNFQLGNYNQTTQKPFWLPIVTIVNIETIPMANFVLLALLPAAVMRKREMWTALALNKPDFGLYNIVTDIFGDGVAIDFNDKKLTADKKIELIQMITRRKTPVLALEANAFGDNTSLTSFMTSAAQSKEEKQENLLISLLDSCLDLTDNKFNISTIGAGDVIARVRDYPAGTFGLGDKTYDTRAVSELNVLKTFNKAMPMDELREKTIQISVLRSLSSDQGSYQQVLKVLNELVPEATVEKSVVSIMFNGRFIDELVSSVIKCGLNIDHNDLVQINENISNINTLNLYNAAMSNNSVNFSTGNNIFQGNNIFTSGNIFQSKF